jgi:hypothetical protein
MAPREGRVSPFVNSFIRPQNFIEIPRADAIGVAFLFKQAVSVFIQLHHSSAGTGAGARAKPQ